MNNAVIGDGRIIIDGAHIRWAEQHHVGVEVRRRQVYLHVATRRSDKLKCVDKFAFRERLITSRQSPVIVRYERTVGALRRERQSVRPSLAFLKTGGRNFEIAGFFECQIQKRAMFVALEIVVVELLAAGRLDNEIGIEIVGVQIDYQLISARAIEHMGIVILARL